MKGNGEEFTMTGAEVETLTRALREPEFRKLFGEYVDEISDPKHRKEHDDYLRQLERAGELPRGVALLRPDPGCCAKTCIKYPNGILQKLFINICYSSRVEEANFGDEKLPGGRNVNLPFTLGPPRPTKDHADNTALTCDMCIGEKTFRICSTGMHLMKMVVETAIDNLKETFLHKHRQREDQAETILRDFKILKKIKCKDGTPAALSVRPEHLKNGLEEVEEVEGYGDAVTPSELQNLMEECELAQKTEEEGKALSEEVTAKEEEEIVHHAPPEISPDVDVGVREPIYRIIQQGIVRICEMVEGNGLPSAMSPVPENLRVEIELPLVRSASEIVSDVADRNVSLEVKDKYKLDVRLPYFVDRSRCSAKFHKKLDPPMLSLVMPVTDTDRHPRPAPPTSDAAEEILDVNDGHPRPAPPASDAAEEIN